MYLKAKYKVFQKNRIYFYTIYQNILQIKGCVRPLYKLLRFINTDPIHEEWQFSFAVQTFSKLRISYADFQFLLASVNCLLVQNLNLCILCLFLVLSLLFVPSV